MCVCVCIYTYNICAHSCYVGRVLDELIKFRASFIAFSTECNQNNRSVTIPSFCPARKRQHEPSTYLSTYLAVFRYVLDSHCIALLSLEIAFSHSRRDDNIKWTHKRQPLSREGSIGDNQRIRCES